MRRTNAAATRGLWAWLLCGLLGLATSCEHAAPLSDGWVPAGEQAAPVALAEVPLDARTIEAVFDAAAQVRRSRAVADALLDAAHAMPAEAFADAPGARAMVIASIYRLVQLGAVGERFTTIRDVVDRMTRAAPAAPETRFAAAYLRWILVSDGRGGLRLGRLDPAVGRELAAALEQLAREHPTFDGPGGFDRRRIRAEAALARASFGLPAAATGTTAAEPAAP
jgi:hypothetical protein